MHSFTSVFASLALLVAHALASPAAPPQFEVLFSGPLSIGDRNVLSGPFGARLNAPVLGGDLTDVAGSLVATVVPATAADGTFFPDAKLTLQWAADGKFAYLHAQGVGELGGSDLTHVHLETDSATWSSLNSRFIVGNLTFGTPDAILTVFGVL
ncbi:hypothetical protein OBBRIDRAFT_839842 [Obba rivulosa]|uniref:Uncharacterized protein n=1 Tax=Obba rivulosa TaxID=1052685 RepID=A0A8E2DET7_9APHY|nr:hypothetical protein OBBRIDRAFT_839842 [Obba rivulosa]